MSKSIAKAFHFAPIGSTASVIAILGFGYSVLFAFGFFRIPVSIPYFLKPLVLFISLCTAIFFSLVSSELYKAHRLMGLILSILLCFVMGVALLNLLNNFGFLSASNARESVGGEELRSPWFLPLFCFFVSIVLYTAYFHHRIYREDFRKKEEGWWGRNNGMQDLVMLAVFCLPYIYGLNSGFVILSGV